MSAKHHAHHQKGEGCRENWREQPARLANTFIHLFSPNLEKQLTKAQAVPPSHRCRTIAYIAMVLGPIRLRAEVRCNTKHSYPQVDKIDKTVWISSLGNLARVPATTKRTRLREACTLERRDLTPYLEYRIRSARGINKRPIKAVNFFVDLTAVGMGTASALAVSGILLAIHGPGSAGKRGARSSKPTNLSWDSARL